MSRPKKNTADYFPHLCNHGKKMSYIERRHGNDGYAVWYKILEKLAQAHDHYLHIEDEIEADFLADYCLVSIEKLREILADLVKVGALDSGAWESKIVYSMPLIESLNDLYTRRKDKPAQLMQIIDRVGGVSVYINSHSIVKDSKVENNIGEESIITLPPSEQIPIMTLYTKFETRAAVRGVDRFEVIELLRKIPENLQDQFIDRCDTLQDEIVKSGKSRYGAEKLIITAMQSLDEPTKGDAERDFLNSDPLGELLEGFKK